MFRKVGLTICALGLCLCLCGCGLFTADTAELLSPPALTGDMLPIDKAIKASVKAEYTLEYPSRGDYRSAIVLHDVNKDGVMEAFAFYSTVDNQATVMNVNYIEHQGGEWSAVSNASIPAGGVDRIDFWDLDHDGTDEILIGWEIYGTSELQLAVYTLEEGNLSQIMLEQYTHFIPCDLNEDDRGEIFIVRAFPSLSKNTAHLFAFSEEGVSQISGCDLDSTAKTLNHPILSTLSSGKAAIYIDEIKGVGAVTEVLYLEKGQLVNPIMDISVKETTMTLRSATIECQDINGDGILEIPVQRELPSISHTSSEEKQYLTEWCSFNGERLTSQLTALMNQSSRYYYVIPQKWIGKIALLKKDSGATAELYRYNPKKKTSGERLLYFKAVKKSDWDAGKYATEDVEELVNNGETSFLCYVSEAALGDGIDFERIKTDFKVY